MRLVRALGDVGAARYIVIVHVYVYVYWLGGVCTGHGYRTCLLSFKGYNIPFHDGASSILRISVTTSIHGFGFTDRAKEGVTTPISHDGPWCQTFLGHNYIYIFLAIVFFKRKNE